MQKKEMKYIDKYDYVIVNKDLEISIENLMSIILEEEKDEKKS